MIFIVDDDAAARDSLRLLLETAGYAAEDLPSAEAFLASHALTDHDCLIADVYMASGLSGIELLENLRRGGNTAPVILVTGRPSASITARAQVGGALAVLERPFDAADMLKLVQDATKS
jgi:two-component system, LuxR family, response regulator FixJ